MGLNQIPFFTSLKVVKAVAALVLQVILLGILSLGLRGALWELVFTAFLGFCMTLAVFIWRSGIDLRAKTRFLKDVLTYGGKAYPGHLGVILLSRVDIYFVALFGGVAAAGFYAVAKGLTEIAAIIEQSISQAVIPGVISADYVAASAIVSRAFRASFWINALILFVGALFARWLIPLIYGQEYVDAAPAFLLLLPGVLLLTTRTLGIFFSMQLGRPEIPTYYILASGLISLPVSYFLTRQFSYLGAAAGFSLVAVFRGSAAIVLFIIFTHAKPRDVLLLSKDDLIWLLKTIQPKPKTYMFQETEI
jgi:O-antigen/teichoic acid export membrane protein